MYIIRYFKFAPHVTAFPPSTQRRLWTGNEVQWNVYNRGGRGLGMRSSGMCTTEEVVDWE